MPVIYVVIATAFKRTDWLLKRSLRSVYLQEGVDGAAIKVIVVDDNVADETTKIEVGISELRESLNLSVQLFQTLTIRNNRTRHNSGTGAWNTGIFQAYSEQPDSFVSILDDDDEYLPNHLQDCITCLESNPQAQAVFQELIWKWPDNSVWQFPLEAEDLNPEKFYTGNPGVQGSNLFVKARTLTECKAFDESLVSTTDRDLMIRLLWNWQHRYPDSWPQKFVVLSGPGVIHYVHDGERVTTNQAVKHKGLDGFYAKYKSSFSEELYQQSLKRAGTLFKYPGFNSLDGCIVILMAMHNNAATVEKAIRSILCQQATCAPLYILVSDDASTDNSVAIVQNLVNLFPNIHFYSNHLGGASQNRNWLQEQVLRIFPRCILIGRLDADDELAEPDILQRIEKLWNDSPFDVLLMSNRQYFKNEFNGFINMPDELLKIPDELLSRLTRMAAGEWEAELPSCNVFLRPQISIDYRELDSAEDHRNLVDYLLQADSLNIRIKPDWIYCNYHIDKHILATPSEREQKRNARLELYKYAENYLANIERHRRAERLLQNWQPGNYQYLGAGFSGVVFHDRDWVYKVHIPIATDNFNEVDNILFLKAKLEIFKDRKHFYPLRELTLVESIYVLVYPYEKSEPVKSLSRLDMISFLAEMWRMKVVCRSITKGNNLVRVNGVIKLIDYEIETYSDNLFLNIAARAYIQLDDFKGHALSYDKLKRSTINNFALPELEGFFSFVSDIFNQCAATEFSLVPLSILKPAPVEQINNKFAVHYDGTMNPSISLLIKACVQDSATIYEDVCWLVKQLTQGVKFYEIALLIDLYKENNFLRQYTDEGNLDQLVFSAQRLKEEGIIDVLIIPPHSVKEIEDINFRWFGVTGTHTYSEKGVPVTSQLYAFEEVQGEFVLQMDADILIGFKNEPSDYLEGMIDALQGNGNSISFGFQICQNQDMNFQPIVGGDGNIPPDVRCSLICRERLLAARPFSNNCGERGWELSWYRALEAHQVQYGHASLRGGSTNAFYVHIQNYRKANRWVWHTIRKGVEHSLIPLIQYGKPEVAGDIFAWCLPKRDEEIVVILYVDENNPALLQETLSSLLAQNQPWWGLVVINNSGDQEISALSRTQCLRTHERTTVIDLEQPVAYNEAIYKAVRYYLTNQESFVCLMRLGDILLYPSVLSECINRLETYGADALIGKEISAHRILDAGISKSNFLHPRQSSECLVNGLSIFRKYLFDALSHLDLKEKMPNASSHVPAFSKIKQTHRWLNDITNISILTPIIELSSNPIRFDHFNVLRTRSVDAEAIQSAVSFVQKQPRKSENGWEKGRKTFVPNTNKIELDITYDCNLKCFHCNRSCTQAPTEAHMTFDQIKQFVDESVMLGKKWQLINVLGGEPTLHPQFEDIVDHLLYAYIIPHSPNTTLQITSNGYDEQVQNKLQALPAHPNLVIDYNSFKDDRSVPYFTPFNLAPVDDPDAFHSEYYKGCWVTSYCGIGLNHLGYFACGVAGGIERILKAGKAIASLTELDERLLEQLNTYCRLCGNFTAYATNRGDFLERAEKDSPPKTAISETWRILYKQYNNEK